MSYRDTLNLPDTDFPMKANLPQREPDWIRFWNENDVFGRRLGGDLRSEPRSGLTPSPDRWCGRADLLVPVTALL